MALKNIIWKRCWEFDCRDAMHGVYWICRDAMHGISTEKISSILIQLVY